MLARLRLDIEARTIEPAHAFHRGLGAVTAALGVVPIFRRFSARPAEALPPETGGLPNYNFAPVKIATLLAFFWGLAGMAIGVVIAFELGFPGLNIAPWLNFGRLEPLHTSTAIFGFGGDVVLATSFYVVQRTCRRVSPAILLPGSSCWATTSSS
jgi:cytochrome c oxidase cbb3-type subunit 1